MPERIRSEGILEGRFQLLDPIGSGSMGVVYRALDQSTAREVALKSLHHRDAEDLYRLKQEFRALSGLRHPNLVEFYDLVVTPERSFVTMELLDGGDFVAHVRGEHAPRGAPEVAGIERLRRLLPQLLAALTHLHGCGWLHRDIKPSNIQVTTDGRLVLLDFGLAALRTPAGAERSGSLVGTLAYMAPELLRGSVPDEAADWYGVGATLFEALCGELPFEGQGDFLRRDSLPTPRPSARVEGVPIELDELVFALLRPEPGHRGGPEALHRCIESAAPLGAAQRLAPELPRHPAFVGRDRELLLLHDAYRRAQRDGTVTLRIAGPSGIGKTALIRHFADDAALAEWQDPPLILAGRCHARESVPFKALDGLIDSLSHHLLSLSPQEASSLVGSSARTLLRLFPVLGRVPAFDVSRGAESSAEPAELRRFAFAALLDLLKRLSQQRPLLLWIDDLQWGDLDSARFLRDLSAARGVRALLVLTHRSEEANASLLVREVAASPAVELVSLAPLDRDATRRLVEELLGGDRASGEQIARESGGSPFLASELARLHARRPDLRTPAVADVVSARVAELTPGSLRLLQVVAVAGGPCELSLAARVADTDPSPAINALRADGLLRESGGDATMNLDTYHAQIREAVLQEIAPKDLSALHLALAQGLAADPTADPLRLVDHYEGAGDSAGAARAARLAAETAYESLAFEQAAALYERTLRLRPDDPDRWRLVARRAEALAQAGRAEAGKLYSEAAELLGSGGEAVAERLDLRRHAAEQYLRNGLLDNGLVELARVLEIVGERMPASPVETLARVVVGRLRLGARGLEPGDSTRRDAKRLARADACWSAAVGLVWFEPLLAAYFHGRHLRLSLDLGDRTHLVRSLCTEAAFQSATGGAAARKRADEALERARGVASRIDDPIGVGLTDVCAAGSAFFAGRFREGVDWAKRAEEVLRGCTGTAWELSNAHFFGAYSLAHLGRVAELAIRMPGVLADANDRGDLLTSTSLSVGLPVALPLLAADRPGEVVERVAVGLASWPGRGFQLPHYYALASRTVTDLYRERPLEAWRRLKSEWPAVRSARLLHFELVRTHLLLLRSFTAFALLADPEAFRVSGESRSRLLRRVAADARRIEGAHMEVAGAWAELVRAGLEGAFGREQAAAARLETAEARLASIDLQLAAAAARWRRGELLGGDGGAQLQRSAATEFSIRGVASAERFTAMLAPSLPNPTRAASPVPT